MKKVTKLFSLVLISFLVSLNAEVKSLQKNKILIQNNTEENLTILIVREMFGVTQKTKDFQEKTGARGMPAPGLFLEQNKIDKKKNLEITYDTQTYSSLEKGNVSKIYICSKNFDFSNLKLNKRVNLGERTKLPKEPIAIIKLPRHTWHQRKEISYYYKIEKDGKKYKVIEEEVNIKKLIESDAKKKIILNKINNVKKLLDEIENIINS